MASTVKEKDNAFPNTLLTQGRISIRRMFHTSVSLKDDAVGYALLSCNSIDVQSLG